MPRRQSLAVRSNAKHRVRLTDVFTVPADTHGWEREQHKTIQALEAAEFARLDDLVTGAAALLKMARNARAARLRSREGKPRLEQLMGMQLNYLFAVLNDTKDQIEPN